MMTNIANFISIVDINDKIKILPEEIRAERSRLRRSKKEKKTARDIRKCQKKLDSLNEKYIEACIMMGSFALSWSNSQGIANALNSISNNIRFYGLSRSNTYRYEKMALYQDVVEDVLKEAGSEKRSISINGILKVIDQKCENGEVEDIKVRRAHWTPDPVDGQYQVISSPEDLFGDLDLDKEIEELQKAIEAEAAIKFEWQV